MPYNKLPNWYGIPCIGFEWRGYQSDPILHYKGHRFNGTDIQDALWEDYLDNGGNLDNEGDWVAWVIANAVNYLDDIITLRMGE